MQSCEAKEELAADRKSEPVPIARSVCRPQDPTFPLEGFRPAGLMEWDSSARDEPRPADAILQAILQHPSFLLQAPEASGGAPLS